MGDQQFRLALLARDTAVPATLGSLAERIASRWAALEDQDAETWSAGLTVPSLSQLHTRGQGTCLLTDHRDFKEARRPRG